MTAQMQCILLLVMMTLHLSVTCMLVRRIQMVMHGRIIKKAMKRLGIKEEVELEEKLGKNADAVIT